MLCLLELRIAALLGIAGVCAGSYSLEGKSSVRHRSLTQAPSLAVLVADFKALQDGHFVEGASEFVDVPALIVEGTDGIPENTESSTTDEELHDDTAALIIDLEQATSLDELIGSKMDEVPPAEATEIGPIRFPGKLLKGSAQHAQHDIEVLDIPPVYAPFHAGVVFPVEGTAEVPGVTLHFSNMTLLAGNATYDELGGSGVMDFFALGTYARVCFSNIMFVLQSCRGFRDGSFHLWCCTNTECNLEYTQANLEASSPSDLEFGGVSDLHALTCHAIDPPDVSQSRGRSTSSKTSGWQNDTRMKWTVIGGSIWAGMLTIVILFSCWLCLRLRARDRDKEFVPYGEPLPGRIPRSVVPADLAMSEWTEHSHALRTPSASTPAASTPVSAGRRLFR